MGRKSAGTSRRRKTRHGYSPRSSMVGRRRSPPARAHPFLRCRGLVQGLCLRAGAAPEGGGDGVRPSRGGGGAQQAGAVELLTAARWSTRWSALVRSASIGLSRVLIKAQLDVAMYSRESSGPICRGPCPQHHLPRRSAALILQHSSGYRSTCLPSGSRRVAPWIALYGRGGEGRVTISSLDRTVLYACVCCSICCKVHHHPMADRDYKLQMSAAGHQHRHYPMNASCLLLSEQIFEISNNK